MEEAANLVFDLASFPRPFRATSVLAFVKQYGLLRYDGRETEGRERFTDWAQVAHQFEILLSSYLAWGTQKGEKADATELKFVSLLNEGLKSVHPSVMVGVDGVGPNQFMMDTHVSDLVGLAYYQFAHLLRRAQKIGRCPECARYFAVKDKRMHYCSTKCSGVVRSRRYYQKKKSTHS